MIFRKVCIFKMSTVKNVCNICNKEFAAKSSLTTHQKTAKFCKKLAESQPSTSSEKKSDTSFIMEMKRNYEQIISDKDERIDTLENLIEKMEAKIERYQNTIMALALRSINHVYTTNTYNKRCSDPSCEGCRSEEREEERLRLIVHIANAANAAVIANSTTTTTTTTTEDSEESDENEENDKKD